MDLSVNTKIILMIVMGNFVVCLTAGILFSINLHLILCWQVRLYLGYLFLTTQIKVEAEEMVHGL
jgi:hypothetical protein